MTDTMRERIARAIAEFEKRGADYKQIADAVLDAMREPTSAMVERGAGMCDLACSYEEQTQEEYNSEIKLAWSVMVDAAKEGK